jgi:hypothetical protein
MPDALAPTDLSALPPSTDAEPIAEIPLFGKRAARIAAAYDVYAAAKQQMDTAQLVLEQLVGAALDDHDIDAERWRGIRKDAAGNWLLRYLETSADGVPTVA